MSPPLPPPRAPAPHLTPHPTPPHPVQDPVLCAWEGMSCFGASTDFRGVAMTKAEYEEAGGSGNSFAARRR